MEYNTDKIETGITILPLLLKIFPMFQLHFGYNIYVFDGFFVETVAIRFGNVVKATGLSMENTNTNYNEIINKSVLNKMLHHVGMSWIIETNQQLKYDIGKHNPD